MDNIPNLKYKTTLCLSWAQGTSLLIQASTAKKRKDATSPTASKTCARSNRYASSIRLPPIPLHHS